MGCCVGLLLGRLVVGDFVGEDEIGLLDGAMDGVADGENVGPSVVGSNVCSRQVRVRIHFVF